MKDKLTVDVTVRMDLATLPGRLTPPQLQALLCGLAQVVAAAPKPDAGTEAPET